MRPWKPPGRNKKKMMPRRPTPINSDNRPNGQSSSSLSYCVEKNLMASDIITIITIAAVLFVLTAAGLGVVAGALKSDVNQ